MIDLYYRDAPGIAEMINRWAGRKQVYEEIYEKMTGIIGYIYQGLYEKAVTEYMLMVYKLRN